MATCFDLLNVTQAQLDRCTRILHENTGEIFYKIESESDPTTEYEVHFIKCKGFTCTCPAGQSGFHTCAHGTCKHVRWSVAHAQAYRQEQEEQSQIEAYVRQGIDRATATRVVYASSHPFAWTDMQVKHAQYNNQPNAFQLMR